MVLQVSQALFKCRAMKEGKEGLHVLEVETNERVHEVAIRKYVLRRVCGEEIEFPGSCGPVLCATTFEKGRRDPVWLVGDLLKTDELYQEVYELVSILNHFQHESHRRTRRATLPEKFIP